jgi:hypothetical protein
LVKIRLHTKNQLPRLPGSALKVPGWWVVASYPLLSQAPTPVEVAWAVTMRIIKFNCSQGFGAEKYKMERSKMNKILKYL